MSERRFFALSVKELEVVVRENWDDATALNEVEGELAHRARGRARRLLGSIRERQKALTSSGTVHAKHLPDSARAAAGGDDGGSFGDDRVGKLLRICEARRAPSDTGAVIKEPYIPFIPRGACRPTWNGILVLGEAQSLGPGAGVFVARLKASSRRDRLCRLYWEDERHVRPWDDGTLKLAMAAAFGMPEGRFAISNAVMWSAVTPSGTNASPSPALRRLSVDTWAEMMPLLEPRCVVTTGAIAAAVVSGLHLRLKAPWVHVRLPSASPLFLARAARNADEAMLLDRNPRVSRVVAEHPEWVAKYRRNKIYYACEAVRIVARAFSGSEMQTKWAPDGPARA